MMLPGVAARALCEPLCHPPSELQRVGSNCRLERPLASSGSMRNDASPLSSSWSQPRRGSTASQSDSPRASSWSVVNNGRHCRPQRASSVPDLSFKPPSLMDLTFKPPPRVSNGRHLQLPQACVLCGAHRVRWDWSWFCDLCGRSTEERESSLATRQAACSPRRVARFPSPSTVQPAPKTRSRAQTGPASRSCSPPLGVQRQSTRSSSEHSIAHFSSRGRSPARHEKHQPLSTAPRTRSQDNQLKAYPTLLGDLTPARKHSRVSTSSSIHMIPFSDDTAVEKHVRFRTKDSLYNDFTPYASIYGAHPKTFNFDADGSMVFFGGSHSVPVSPRSQVPPHRLGHRQGSPVPHGAASAPSSAACSPRTSLSPTCARTRPRSCDVFSHQQFNVKAAPQVPKISPQRTFRRADLEALSADALRGLAITLHVPPPTALAMERFELLQMLVPSVAYEDASCAILTQRV
mmetsp:Transcript_108620/g.192023  ORF Transcript_108620/g.192023 Transcript_108620/m.192023 type:complete len:461 (-) Transcript_108620:24-1406(-)